MQQKGNSSVGSGAQARNNGLSLSDKYVALQFENQKLRRALRKVGAAFQDWRERALEYQAERDYYREQAQAGKDGET